jgi:hypothetical protein
MDAHVDIAARVELTGWSIHLVPGDIWIEFGELLSEYPNVPTVCPIVCLSRPVVADVIMHVWIL